MSIDIERDICGDEQQSSFQNATLQSGPPGYEFSVAVHLDVPLIGCYDQDTLEQFIKRTFAPIAHDPRVSIHVQMGREGAGDRFYLDWLQACAVEELPRRDDRVEVVVHPELDSQGFNTVMLVSEKPGWIIRFVRTHWGEDDEGWLLDLENRIEYGEAPVYARKENMMVTVTYDTLNDLVHEVGDAIEKQIGIGKDMLDLFALNDTVTEYLGRYGVLYEDERDDEFDPNTQAITNIKTAIDVIAPIWEDMQKFGHSQADDVAGAQSDLEQAVRYLTGEEEPS